MRLKVKLDTVDDVNKFCALASKFPQDIDVQYKHYVLDAKSVLGIQSIPRDEKLEVYVHNLDLSQSYHTDIVEAFSPFIVAG